MIEIMLLGATLTADSDAALTIFKFCAKTVEASVKKVAMRGNFFIVPPLICRVSADRMDGLRASGGPFRTYRYLPVRPFHRTLMGSRNAASPRQTLTFVPATSFHLTGTSRHLYPSCRAT